MGRILGLSIIYMGLLKVYLYGPFSGPSMYMGRILGLSIIYVYGPVLGPSIWDVF